MNYVLYTLPEGEPAEVDKVSYTEYGPVHVKEVHLPSRYSDRGRVHGVPICEVCAAPRGALLFWCAKHQQSVAVLRYRAVLEEMYIAAIKDPVGALDGNFRGLLLKGDEALAALVPSDRAVAGQMGDYVKRRLQAFLASAKEAQQPEPWIDF